MLVIASVIKPTSTIGEYGTPKYKEFKLGVQYFLWPSVFMGWVSLVTYFDLLITKK